METSQPLIELLNDLVKINNDRIAGYEKALGNVKDLDIDLQAVYVNMADQSRDIADELTAEIEKRGFDSNTHDSTLSGKIYRLWMGIKATFSGHDRQSSLDACEFGEDAAQQAYASVLTSDIEMSADIRKMIIAQMEALQTSHNLIRKYRDANHLAA